jgi:hypothetical protein
MAGRLDGLTIRHINCAAPKATVAMINIVRMPKSSRNQPARSSCDATNKTLRLLGCLVQGPPPSVTICSGEPATLT